MAYIIQEKELAGWEHFKEIANNSRTEWIFRGQSDSKWTISSSLERSGMSMEDFNLETRLLDEFKRISKYYLGTNIPSKLIDWLALLQHFGVPTRLVDFTKSPYVAAFFALEEESNAKYASVYIANKNSFYNTANSNLNENNVKCKGGRDWNYCFKNKTLKDVLKKCHLDGFEGKCIFPIQSYYMNERYMIQQGLFLCQANPYIKFEEQLDVLNTVNAYSLVKLVIPRSERKKALRDLDKMNITHASLFPGLDGFSKSLTYRFKNNKSVDDMSREISFLKDEGLLPE